jgi:hypothetical protein
MHDNTLNLNGFGSILRLYRDSQATPDQYKDLFFIGFEKLKDFVNANIDWKFSKISDENKKVIRMDPEVVHALIQLSLIFNGEPTQIFVNNYDDVNDYLKNIVKNAIFDLYKMVSTKINISADTYVDPEYGANIIKEMITNINKHMCNKDNVGTLYGVEGTPFIYFVSRLFLEKMRYADMWPDIINSVIDECCCRKNHRIVSDICPYANTNSINDIYDTVYYLANKSDASDMLMSLLTDSSVCNNRPELCKMVKLSINNINHFYNNRISKSCEAAIMEGIPSFVNEIFETDMYDTDSCVTALEAVTYGIDIATEANEYNDEPDEMEDPDAPIENNKAEARSQANQRKKISSVRDFDAEYRKYKKNASNVDASLTKILSTLKGFLTGTSEARGVRKATGMDSVAQILARVFGTVAIFSASKFLGILFIVVRLANSNKVTERERAKLISEIQAEIDVIDSQLSDGSVESNEARHDLIRTKRNLEDALKKIQSRSGKFMSEGSKQAVRNIINDRR